MVQSLAVEKRPTPKDLDVPKRPVYHLVCACQDFLQHRVSMCGCKVGRTVKIRPANTPVMEVCVICSEVFGQHQPCPLCGKPV